MEILKILVIATGYSTLPCGYMWIMDTLLYIFKRAYYLYRMLSNMQIAFFIIKVAL